MAGQSPIRTFMTDPGRDLPRLEDAWSLLADGLQFHRFFLEVKPMLWGALERDLAARFPDLTPDAVRAISRSAKPGVLQTMLGDPGLAETIRSGHYSRLPVIEAGSLRLPVFDVSPAGLTQAGVETLAWASGQFGVAEALLDRAQVRGYVEIATHLLLAEGGDGDRGTATVSPFAATLREDAHPLQVACGLVRQAGHTLAESFFLTGWDSSEGLVDARPSLGAMQAAVADALEYRLVLRLEQHSADPATGTTLAAQVVDEFLYERMEILEGRLTRLASSTLEDLLRTFDGNMSCRDLLRTVVPWDGQFQQYRGGIGAGQSIG
jgi:hypothetical protein